MKHKGFTLIEVTLFLALSTALFIGIIVATQNSIYEQRFYDSVQSFTEFLRSIYSEVSNPQSIGSGQSLDYAIYGKLVTFGESKTLNGEDNDEDRIFVYDVIGRASCYDDNAASSDVQNATSACMVSGSSLSAQLASLNANVVLPEATETADVYRLAPAGLVESYLPKWESGVEKVDTGTEWDNRLFKGALLIVRHPRSGTINTLVIKDKDATVEVNQTILNYESVNNLSELKNINPLISHLNGTTDIAQFEAAEVSFCITPNRAVSAERRQEVRLIKNSRNASGVEIIPLDGSENQCRE